jgi:hypothetical protein
MARSKTISIESESTKGDDEKTNLSDCLIMTIEELNKLTESEKQLFRANGGTATEN